MTQQFRPNWEESETEPEKVDPVMLELARLRELRNECLNEVPIKLNVIAEATRRDGRGDFADELISLGLRIKRMAEEAR